jgi:hypothetical protein
MQQVEVERLLDVIARLPGEAAQGAVIREQAGTFLRASVGIGTVLRVAAMEEEGPRRDVACALLSAALDGAHMEAENGSPVGVMLHCVNA